MSHRGATVSALDVVSFTSPPSAGFCWWGSACNLWPSRAQAATRFPDSGRSGAGGSTSSRCCTWSRPGGRADVSPAAVSRALRTTNYRNDELLIQR